jgi:peroxiredoxin
MKRILVVLQVVLLLTSACCAQSQESAQTAKQEKLGRQISDLQNQVDALLKAQEFAQASDKLERLQMLCMDAGRYQEALNASFKIEEISPKVSNRETPWNYVRIAEVYLRLGDQDKYFDWMEKAVHERGFYRLEFLQDGRLNAVKDDPRYKKLIDACAKEIGLGQKAKDFRITLLDGSSFTLSAQTGKVVLVDFWDVRCPPCRREMPNLKELFKDFRDKGLEIVGISLDTDRALLDDFVKKEKLPWKISCSLDGWSDSTVKLYKISATPSTWLIDRRGVARYYAVRGEDLRRAVEKLILEQ